MQSTQDSQKSSFLSKLYGMIISHGMSKYNIQEQENTLENEHDSNSFFKTASSVIGEGAGVVGLRKRKMKFFQK